METLHFTRRFVASLGVLGLVALTVGTSPMSAVPSASAADACGTGLAKGITGDKDGFNMGWTPGQSYADFRSIVPTGEDDGAMDRLLIVSRWAPSPTSNPIANPTTIKPVPFTIGLMGLPANPSITSIKLRMHMADVDDGFPGLSFDDRIWVDGLEVMGALDNVNQVVSGKTDGVSGYTGIVEVNLPVSQFADKVKDGQMIVYVDDQNNQTNDYYQTEIFAIDYAEAEVGYATNCVTPPPASSAASSAPVGQCSNGNGTVYGLAGDKDGFGQGIQAGQSYEDFRTIIPQGSDAAGTDRLVVVSRYTNAPSANPISNPSAVEGADIELQLNGSVPSGATVSGIKLKMLVADIDDGNSQFTFDDKLWIDGIEVPGAFDSTDQVLGTNGVQGYAGVVEFNLNPQQFASALSDGKVNIKIDDAADPTDNYYVIEIFAVDYAEMEVTYTGGQCANSSSSVTSSATSTSKSSSSNGTKQCNDGIDNDGDGATDSNDFSCSGPNDDDETNPRPQCADGIDNDGDGRTDMNDPGCSNNQDNDESNPWSSSSFGYSSQSSYAVGNCADGRDNEGDNKIDANDPDCHFDGNANNPNSYVPTYWENTFNGNSSSSKSSKKNRDDDLDITVEASATEAFPGATIEYVITVENDTGEDLNDLVITASFDEDDFRVTDDGDADDDDDGELMWEIGDLDDGDEEEVEFRLRIDNGVNPGSTLTVDAEVRADDGTENDDDVDVRVIGNLPQTGTKTLGGTTAYLTKASGETASGSMPLAGFAGLALTGLSAGAYLARKAFIG